MEKTSKIYIAGHRGMVGSAILRNLQKKGYTNFVLRTHSELDLTDQVAVNDFFRSEKPDFVFLAAAKVGGIVANNTYKGQFIYENLMIQNNIIHAAHCNDVKKLMFLGSSCIYPRMAEQPIKEEALLTGMLEPTNEPYALAKIAGIKMCEAYHAQYGDNYISVMPTNLYGPNDNYDLEKSHVLPALIRKMHLGKLLMAGDWTQIRADLNRFPIEGTDGTASEQNITDILAKYGIGSGHITLWGTGSPLREFLHVDDMAAACVYLMQTYDAPDRTPSHINIGSGTDLSIKNLAETVKQIVGYEGQIVWDSTKPDGTPRKLMDNSKLKSLGFIPQIALANGIRSVYHSYCG